MTHITELRTLEERLLDSGWVIIEEERVFVDDRGTPRGDIDLLAMKLSADGRVNMLYIEEKSGESKQYSKALKQLKKEMKYIIEMYNPDRLWGMYAHKQEVKRTQVYEAP